jgi:hypothetical protein
MLFSRFVIRIFLLTAIALGVVGQAPARADSADDALARVQALEKEIVAIKKENEALRQVTKLRAENASLKNRHVSANSGRPTVRDLNDAYAADLPAYVKAVAPAEQARLRLWGEGGAIWSGGDPIYSFYQRVGLTPNNFTNDERFFPLVPKVGWDAAVGFDYRFADSPWHASGQFRYGEARTTVTSSSSTSLIIDRPPPTLVSASDSERVTHKETRWLADLALGRDFFGGSADAMQLKFGVRVAELQATTNSVNSVSQVVTGIFSASADNLAPQEHRFLGAGPRFGVEGAAPIGRGWTFDYLGDIAVLFGTQKLQRLQSIQNFVSVPAGLGPIVQPLPETVDKFGTVFNSDIQVGVSYWMSQNAKVSLSYRLDAYFNVFSSLDAQNDSTRLRRIDRYTHGPRLGVTAQF